MMKLHPCLPLLLALALPALAQPAAPRPIPAHRPFVSLTLGVLRSLAIDRHDALYIPDTGNCILYKMTTAGEVTTLPTGSVTDLFTVTVTPDGTVYAAESEVHQVHRLTPAGSVSLVPEGAKNLFIGCTSLGADAAGNLYVAENTSALIRKITPDGHISILAGALKQWGHQDGKGPDARFSRPRGLAVTPDGTVYVADEADSVIRKITSLGHVTTLAGAPGKVGSQDGHGAHARFLSPKGLAATPDGTVYVMDTNNHTLRKITPDGHVTTLAGKAGERGFVDGIASEARFSGPRAAVVDSAGNLLIVDGNNNAIRMLTPEGQVVTLVAPQLPLSVQSPSLTP